MIFFVGKDQIPCKIVEIFQQSGILEPIDGKKNFQVSAGDPVILKGNVDKKRSIKELPPMNSFKNKIRSKRQ